LRASTAKRNRPPGRPEWFWKNKDRSLTAAGGWSAHRHVIAAFLSHAIINLNPRYTKRFPHLPHHTTTIKILE
jgi:hypothetical protein